MTEETLEELMTLSGLEAQLGDMPASIRDALLQGAEQQSASPQEAARIARIANQTIMVRDFRRSMTRTLGEQLSEEDAQALLQWFASDAGRRITAAEERASTPAAQEEMRRRAQALMLSETRVEIARRMDGVIGATEMLLDIQEQTLRGTFRVLAREVRETLDEEAIERELLGSRAARRAATQQYVTASLVYTYNRIELEELRAYLAVIESPAGRRFHDVAVATIAADTEAAVVAFAELMISEAVRDAAL